MLEIFEAIALGVQPFLVQVPLRGAEWADQNFYLSAESSGTEGRWKTYPYQVAMLNWMTSDDIEEINWQKSRRVGYTKCLLAAIGCLIEQKKRNIVTWQPTDGDAKDFVVDEVETMLRDVPVLGDLLRCEVGQKSKHNTLDKKVFTGATWDIKGGKSARNFRRMSKDVATYDELSAFDQDIDNEGSATELGDGRLDQAPFPKSIRGSTPKIKGACQIETAVEASDMVFYRFVRCSHCGQLQRLEFANLRWENEDPKTTCYICRENGCVLYYRDYPRMDAAGRWQTLDGNYYDDKLDRFFNANDELIEKPRRIGAKIWAVYSYLRPWSYLVDRWLAASKEAKNGKITTLKSVINTLLGETFEEQGERVDKDVLARRGRDYLAGGTIPDGVLVVTSGADIQGGANARIELEYVGWGIEDESWSLGYEVIPGDAERPEVWDNLDELLRRRFPRKDGVTLGVACAFIDSGYLAHEVYRFTGPRKKRNIWATKGVNTGQLVNKGTWQGDEKKKGRAILRTTNVDDAKTVIFNRLRIAEPGPGYCHFPDTYDEEYFERLTNEEKREKLKKGLPAGFEWVKIGPNEPLDCRAYAMAAKEFLNPNMAREKLKISARSSVLQKTGGGIVGHAPAANVAAETKPRPLPAILAKRRGGGWVGKWK